MNSNKKLIFYTSFFMLLGVAFIGFIYPKLKQHQDQKPSLPVIGNDQNHHVGPFSFLNQDGQTINNESVKGKICVVEYFFATCPSICPKMNENMVKVYKAFRGDKNVLILSHTVNPKHDTVQVLKAYSLRFDADPQQWMFLTGGKKQLYDMARYSYLINAEDTTSKDIEQDFIHDQHFVLVDAFGRIRGFYDGLDQGSVGKLIEDIKTLEREKSNP